MVSESKRQMTAAACVAVRLARSEDLGSAALLFDAYRQFYGATSDIPGARRFLTARLEQDESVLLLASAESTHATGSEEAIGFAQLYRSFSSVSLGAIIILNDLFVAPEWRRFGVARQLVDGATAYAQRTGAIWLEVATQHTNRPALGLYRSRGFAPETEFTHLSLAMHSNHSVR